MGEAEVSAEGPRRAALRRLRVRLLWLWRHHLLQVGAWYLALIAGCAAVFAWVLPEAAFDRPVAGLGDALYFSVVTVTTLGYGDISPVSGWAKGVASLEALLGYVLAGTFLYRLSLAYSAREAMRHRERYRRLTRRFRKEALAMTRSALSYLYPSLEDEGLETGEVPDDPRRLTRRINSDPDFAPDDVYEHFFSVMGNATDRARLLKSLHRLEDLLADQPHFVEMAAQVRNVEYTELTERCLATIENLERFLESEELERPWAGEEAGMARDRLEPAADDGTAAGKAGGTGTTGTTGAAGAADDGASGDRERRRHQWRLRSIKSTVRPAFRSLALLYEELREIEQREVPPGAARG